jgi:hypothetical protein
MTEPIREIIPRNLDDEAKKMLDYFSETLEEFVNFGSHIMSWDSEPKTTGEENIPPSMLFRHFLDLIDSISILVRNGCGDTSKLLLRGALEVMLQLEYLFEKDTHDRAMAFLVVEILNEIKTLKKYDPGALEGAEMHKLFTDEKLMPAPRLHLKEDLKDAVNKKMKLFDLPQFQKAYAESQRLTTEKVKKPKWYRYYDGPQDIRSLAIHLKMGTFYESLYRKWSGSTHGSDVYLGKVTRNDVGGVDIVQLRFIRDVQEVVRFSLSFTIKVFITFMRNRIPDKKTELGEWYKTIQAAYLDINSRNFYSVD